MKPDLIRLCLNENGTFTAYGFYGGEEGDYANDPLPSRYALILMTSGEVPFEVATNDPTDTRTHNYETIDLIQLNYI